MSPTIKKGTPLRTPSGVKDPIWKTDNMVIFLIKLGIQILVFFFLLVLFIYRYSIQDDLIIYSIFIYLNYLFSGIFAFLVGYGITKVAFNKAKYRIKSLTYYIKGKRRFSKVWIFLLTILFQTVCFVSGVHMLLVMWFDTPEAYALIWAWIVIALIAKAAGRLTYVILYNT